MERDEANLKPNTRCLPLSLNPGPCCQFQLEAANAEDQLRKKDLLSISPHQPHGWSAKLLHRGRPQNHGIWHKALTASGSIRLQLDIWSWSLRYASDGRQDLDSRYENSTAYTDKLQQLQTFQWKSFQVSGPPHSPMPQTKIQPTCPSIFDLASRTVHIRIKTRHGTWANIARLACNSTLARGWGKHTWIHWT